ncbi:hypothetical protein GCM10027511_15660 [Hymenobacter humi]
MAFRGISTIYSYPKKEAAAIAVREEHQWMASHEFTRTVVIVAFDDASRQLYEQELSR